MFGNKNKIEKQAESIIKEFFKKTSFEVEIRINGIEKNTISVVAELENPQALIGEGGKTLFSIQHLLNKLLRRKLQDDKEIFYIDLDINDYKKKKNDFLKELARTSADEVSLSGKEKELRPMPAHDRRIIHLELQERTDIKTESIGQGVQRRIVIKPL